VPEIVSVGARLVEVAVGLAILLLVAGLTHILVILLLPGVATKDAYDLLAARYDHGGGLVLLAPSKPGDTLIPFRDPATVQGLCFYDLSKGPVRVRLKTDEGRLLTLSFRTPEGRVFYSMTDKAALNGAIDIRLLTDAQLKVVEDGDNEDQGLPTELRLKSPGKKGLLVATALISRPSETRDAEERIKAIGCAPEPLPPPA
jgi:uncharacterized membrane protein